MKPGSIMHPPSVGKIKSTGQLGQSLAEFAIVVPLFFLLIFGLLDFGRLFFTQATLQHALREAGRFAVTGRHLPDGKGGDLSRVDSILSVAEKQAFGLSIDRQDVVISSQVGGAGNAGGPGDTVTISLNYSMRLLTPIVASFFNNGRYDFRVATTFRNEPFPIDLTN